MIQDVTLRTMRQGDVDAVAAQCAETLTYDEFANHLPCLLSGPNHYGIVATAAHSDGKIIGACIVSTDETTTDTVEPLVPVVGSSARSGYLDLLVVSPSWQGGGVGKRLLAAAEELLVDLGCTEVKVAGNSPHYAWPGVDVRYLSAVCLLDANGYERHATTLNLSVSFRSTRLATRLAEERLAKQGVRFKRGTSQDAPWLHEELAPLWKARWVDQITSVTSTATRYNHHQGLHLALVGTHCVGFCAWGVSRPNELGPLGTHPDFRRLGIGGVLLRRCCRDQRKLGLCAAELQWAGPLEYFSRALNAKTSRVFFMYTKRVGRCARGSHRAD